jgi:translation initiation factor 2A
MAAAAALPPLNLYVREPDGLSLLVGPPFAPVPVATIDKVTCNSARFSDDGSKLAVITPDAVTVYACDTGKEVLKLLVAGVAAISFSPQGSYLQTFQKPQAQQKNLTIWNALTGAIVLQQFQKSISKTTWPTVQFSEDESIACRIVTNEVHFFDGHDFAKGIVDRLRLSGIDGVQLSSSPPSHIATYVPEIKGAPASVQIFERTQVSQAQPVARRSFFKSNTAQLTWNKGSTGVLVLATSDVDKTNQSYYGESRLHFLTSDGRHEGAVPLSKEGPIHDVQWSPTGKDFLVIYGFMPAKATLFSAVCKPLFEFGQGPYNTIRWSPQGRCIQLQALNVVCSAGSHANLMIHIEEERRKGQKCKGNMFKCLFAPCLGYLQEEDLYVNLTFCTHWIDLQIVWWLNIIAAFCCLMWSEPLMD